ncbi:hypothetical protein FRC00_005565 [Tulasnella sp. 408]|nr:hypothetical protein FRC00_005565 [Tulasnella sp. 408]
MDTSPSLIRSDLCPYSQAARQIPKAQFYDHLRYNVSRLAQPRSASPEPPTASATSSTTNKRRRSDRLQAAKAEKEKAVIKLQPAPLVASQARGPTRSRSTTAKAPAPGQVVRSRQKKEAPHGLTHRRSQRLAPARGEEPAPPGHDSLDSEHGEKVTQEPLSTRRSSSPSPEKSRTTLVNFDPEVGSSGVPQKEYIDFGSLVPDQRTRSRKSICLRFVDDGPRATTLTITPQSEESSQSQVTLWEGCSIRFGAKNEHGYRFVPAQQPLPDPLAGRHVFSLGIWRRNRTSVAQEATAPST